MIRRDSLRLVLLLLVLALGLVSAFLPAADASNGLGGAQSTTSGGVDNCLGKNCSVLSLSTAGAVNGGSITGATGTFTSDAGVRTPVVVATAPSSQAGLVLTRGARLCLDNSCNHHFSEDATTPNQANFSSGLAISMASAYVVTTVSTQSNTTGLSCNGQSSGTNCIAMNAGARVDFGAGSTDYLSGDGTAVQATGYFEQQMSGAAAPTATDCDNDNERGRQYIETTNNLLYVCNGATRGWDHVALTD